MSSKTSLRIVLADAYISDVAIAVLLFWSVGAGAQVLMPALFHGAMFIFTVAAIRGVPSYLLAPSIGDRLELIGMLGPLITCVMAAASAWMLARWMYHAGPIAGLSRRLHAMRRSSRA